MVTLSNNTKGMLIQGLCRWAAECEKDVKELAKVLDEYPQFKGIFDNLNKVITSAEEITDALEKYYFVGLNDDEYAEIDLTELTEDEIQEV